LNKPQVARALLRAMSQANSIKAQVAGRHRSAFVERLTALIVVAIAFTVLVCLAALAPAVWAFATAAIAETHIPVGSSRCLSINDDPSRLACYDQLARRPAKGVSGPFHKFGEVQREW
jgi:hypothetical protein